MITAAVIDTREPQWVQQLTFGGVPTSCMQMEAGDLMATTSDGAIVLIERKTPTDLLSSIADGRILHQVARMQDVTRWCYLVISGELEYGLDGKVLCERRATGWNIDSVRGLILSIQEMGAFVTHCSGDDDYEAAVMRICARDHGPDPLLPPVKMPRTMSAQEAFIASLPGIGPERMRIILDYCGTPAWALVALTDPSTKIPGIPQSVKNKVRATLRLQDDMQITLVTNDQGHEVIQIAELGAQ